MALLSTDPVCMARDQVTNDLIIPQRIARGLEAIGILVRSAWMLWRDEWFLNRDVGPPWLETEDGVVTERDAILGQPYDAAKIKRALTAEALKINGVRDVLQFRSTFDGETRNMTASCVARSDFGDAPVSVDLTL